MSEQLRGDDPRTFMGQIEERITGHAPGYDIAISARPHQWRYLVDDQERVLKALDGMIKCFDPAALTNPPESAFVRRKLEEARAALGHQVRDCANRRQPMFTTVELSLLRQWFNTLQDTNPAHLEPADRDLFLKIKAQLDIAGFQQQVGEPQSRGGNRD